MGGDLGIVLFLWIRDVFGIECKIKILLEYSSIFDVGILDGDCMTALISFQG